MRKPSQKARLTIRPAFTLVELIVVITILAILATVWFLALSGYGEDAKSASAKANARSVFSAIASESAITGNSPRYYVVHDAAAALTWAVAYVDGQPVVLTWGDWNAQNTNYSAGNPDFVKLKLNPEKFKISSTGFGFSEVLAAYDAGSLSVGAIETTVSTTSGKPRSVAYFQVAGISKATKKASVVGNFPVTSQTGVVGLIRNLSDSSLTGALVDEGSASYAPIAAAVVSNLVWNDVSWRNWSDWTYAATCSGYLNPPSWKTYAGASGDGTYWIDPDWAGGIAAFKAYCDMSGGGWTRVGYTANLPFQQQFSGWDAWRFLASDFSLEFSAAQVNAIRAASSEGKQTYVHSCDGVIGYFYTAGPNYNNALGFRFQNGITSPRGLASYSPISVSIAQDGCKSNGWEAWALAQATIFNISSINVPVVNVQTQDSWDTGEKFWSPLMNYPAYFR